MSVTASFPPSLPQSPPRLPFTSIAYPVVVTMPEHERVFYGDGQYIMLHELCAVNVKEAGSRPVLRHYQVLKFARGDDGFVKGVEIPERQRKSWWFQGQLLLPKNEVCPSAGHLGYSWLTESTVAEWEIGLFMDNRELILTDVVDWFPVSGITTARPQVWHPSTLKQRSMSIAGTHESYVVYHRVELKHRRLVPLAPEEVLPWPEERLGWSGAAPSLTLLSRTSVQRVTMLIRRMMAKGPNQRRAQGTIPYTRAEWSMFLERYAYM